MNVGSSIVTVACKPEWSINPSTSVCVCVCVQGVLAPSHRQPSKLLQRLSRCRARRSRPALATQMQMGPCLKRWARVVDGHWRSATDMGDVFRSARVVLEVEMLCVLRSGDRRLMLDFEQRKGRGQIIWSLQRERAADLSQCSKGSADIMIHPLSISPSRA